MGLLSNVDVDGKKKEKKESSSIEKIRGNEVDGEMENDSLPEIDTDPDGFFNSVTEGSQNKQNGNCVIEIVSENNNVELREGNFLPET